MQFAGNTVDETAIQGTPKFALAVPSDSTAYTNIRGLLCTATGTASLKNHLDATVAVIGTVGVVYPISPAKILAATTGTWIILY